MKVELLVSRAGADFVQSAGDIIDVGEEEALRLVASAQAVVVEKSPERATNKRHAEKAVKP
ncbi:hypothetical protein [Haliea salexigens]|uniref:hypothetical protein n=1 Tax=Haliea salexigens TaxID=287487 RepID=UPI0004126C2E|nr:hypothetical protein [Haliea salexigens]